MLQIHFPAALALIPVAVAAALLLMRGTALSGARRASALTLRILAITLLGAAVSAPTLESQTRIPHHVTFVLDISAGVPDAALDRGMRFIERESAKLAEGGNLSSLVVFAGQSHLYRSPAAEPLRFDRPLRAKSKEQREALRAWNEKIEPLSTRWEPAIREARWLAPVHAKHTIVLLSDGYAEDLGSVSLDSIVLQPLKAEHPLVCVQSTRVPLSSRFGEPFGLDVEISSTGTTSGTLRVSIDGVPKPELEKKIAIQPGRHSVLIPNVSAALPSGLHRVEAFLEVPDDPERANKGGAGMIQILGKPRVLILRESTADEKAMEALLKLQDMEVVIETPSKLPADLNGFDSIIVIGAPDPTTPEDVWTSVRSYVQDGGGGLLFVGHPKTAALPKGLEDLLPVAFEPPPAPPTDESKPPPPPPQEPPPGKSEMKKVLAPQVTLLVLIDKSGSMAGTNIGLAKQACLAAVKALSENDYVGVIAFDGRPHWVVKPTLANGIKQIEDDILRLYASGGTNIYNALIEAEQVMNQVNTPIRHVLLLSDGETSPANFDELAQRMAKEGITISTITLLEGNFDLALMRSIAENGKGRYLWAKDARSLPQIFTNEVKRVVGKSDKPATSPPVADPVKPPPSDPRVEPPKPPEKPVEQPPFQPVARTLHESILAIDFKKSPFLRGMIPGKAKTSSIVPLMSHRDEKPVLAFWRVGLGKTAVWTSDFGADWSQEFVAWPPATKMMAQIVRSISSNLRNSTLYSKIRRDGNRLTVDSEQVTASQPLQREGGLHVLPIPPLEPGQEMQITFRSGEDAALVGVIGAAPSEHLNIGLNPQIFDRAASPMDTLVLGESAREPHSEDLIPWLLLPAILLLTLDLLIRRIRL